MYKKNIHRMLLRSLKPFSFRIDSSFYVPSGIWTWFCDRPLGHNVRITMGIVCKYHVIKTAAGNLCNGLIRYWTGPLACLSLPSVMSRIRSDTSTWKLALSQSCSPRIEKCRKRVKCLFRWTLMNEIDGQYYSRMDVPTLSMLLRPILPVATIWNTGETGDIYTI